MRSDTSSNLGNEELKFGLAVATFGVVAFSCSNFLAVSRFEWGELAVLGLLCLYGEWRAVKLPGYGIINPGEAFYLAAACLYGPVPGALLAAVSGLAGDVRKQKRPALALFNLGWALTTFSLAGAVYPWLGLAGAALTYAALAASLQALGERTFSSLPLTVTLTHQYREMILLGPATFLFAYLTMHLFSLKSPVVLLLVLPVELVVTYIRTRELSKELEAALTELRQTQSELVAAGRRAALGVMAAGVAHELNNPLAAAVTNVHMLKVMNSDVSLDRCLALLEKAVERCQTITGRMLKYSRQSPERNVACDPVELVNDALLFCGREFGPQGVVFRARLEGVPKVLGDPTELVQILSNLLSNAHDSGGSTVEVMVQAGDNSVQLLICDDGVGIEEQVQQKIFDPFFTTKAVGSGTGLGLSIAQTLARGSGGDLLLKEARPGRTVFELRLRRDSAV